MPAIFFVILALYTGAHVLVGRLLWQALPSVPLLRGTVLAAFVLLGTGWIAGTILIRAGWRGALLEGGLVVSYCWLAFFFYLLLLLGLLALIRLGLGAVAPDMTGGFWAHPGGRFAIAGSIAALLTVAGAINAGTLTRRDYTVSVPGLSAPLTVAFLSDLHIGTTTSKARLEAVVSAVNATKPDLILIGGDLIDMSPGEDRDNRCAAILQKFRAKSGVFACPGNHEYIASPQAAFRWIETAGVTLLDDAATNVAGLTLVGRRDRSAARHGMKRKPVIAILAAAVKSATLPLVILDHEPRALDEAEAHAASLVLSGHTHHGQLWPLNWITGALYENSHGLLLRGRTSAITSSGVSLWGPPVRTSSRPEYVVIRLEPEAAANR